MTITKIEGLADLHKLMQELPAKIEANVMRGALRAGQMVIVNEARRNVPTDSGALKKSIRIRFHAKSRKYGWLRAHVVAGNKEAWYPHLIEYGTASYYTGTGNTVGKPYIIKAKDSTGNELGVGLKRRALKIGATMAAQVVHPGIKPQPFMRPAAAKLETDALKAFADYASKRIAKEYAKK